MIEWLWSFHHNLYVALYCSDVSGAFDRVNSEKLIAKLKSKGVSPNMINVFISWLGERTAFVVVDGCKSTPAVIKNMVYQGTVWGPPLWNVFFEDARHAINNEGFLDVFFAGGLNSFKSFPGSGNPEDIFIRIV